MPIVLANKIQIYYEIYGNPKADPIVLISGIGQSYSFWKHIVMSLQNQFYVVTLDNRGIGNTDQPDMMYTVELMASDVLAIVEHLNLQNLTLIGHSLGAAIAFEFGLKNSSITKNVVMVSGLYPGPLVVMPSARAIQILSNRDGEPEELIDRGLRIATAPDFFSREPILFQELKNMALNRKQASGIFTRQSSAGGMYLSSDKLQSNSYPTELFLIYGELDEVAQVENGHRIKSKLPDAELHIIRNAGHLVPYEKKDEFVKIIEQIIFTKID